MNQFFIHRQTDIYFVTLILGISDKKLYIMKVFSVFCTLALASSLVFAAEEKKKDDKKAEKEKVGTVIGIDLGTTYSW